MACDILLLVPETSVKGTSAHLQPGDHSHSLEFVNVFRGI